MRKITFTVTLEFADKISDDNEVQEVAQNIANSLKHDAEHYGLAPENSDNYTKSIEVANSGLILSTIKLA